MDNDYPPYVFSDNKGKLQGILVDEWRLWENQTGIKADIHGMNWSEALQRMRSGEFDVIDTIFKTQERTAYWDFSKPYSRIDVPIFFRKDISGITDLKSLKGFPVAAKAGDAAVDLLRRNGITTVLQFNSYEAIVKAAKQHQVNVFIIDKPPALYYLNKLGLQDEFRESAPVNTGEFHRAVKKGNVALLRTVEEGFAAIDPAKLKRIEDKWYGQTLGRRRNFRYVGYAALAALLLILGLGVWSVTLKRLGNLRTAALRESEAFRKRVFESSPIAIVIMDAATDRFIDCNRAAVEVYGFASREDTLGKTPQEVSAPTQYDGTPSAEKARLYIAEAQAQGSVVFEWRHQRANGEIWDAEVHLMSFQSGQRQLLQFTLQDISERKRAAQALQASEERYRQIARCVPDLIWTIDLSGRFTYANSAVERTHGWTPEEFVRLTYPDVATPQQAAKNAAMIQEELARAASAEFDPNRVRSFESEELRKDGSTFWAEVSATFLGSDEGRPVGIIGITRDITERRRAAEALDASEKKFRSIFEAAPVGIFQSTLEGRLLSVNPTGTRMFGYDSSEAFVAAAADMSWQLFVSPGQRQTMVQEALGCEGFVHHEVEYRRKDGSVFVANLYMRAVRGQGSEKTFVEGFVEDITQRKQAEAELRRINRTLRMLGECNQVLVRAADETALLQAICHLLVEDGGYRMAWVGFAEEDEAKSVRPVAQAGFVAGYLDTVNATWADNERGRGPAGTAIRTGQAFIIRNVLTDPAFSPWRPAALQRGYAACAALPLKGSDRVLGALLVYTAEPQRFDDDEVELLNQLASDLAYGITALRTRAEQRLTEEELHRLSAHLLQVQDLERRRLARELHDTTAQHLAALTVDLANLKGLLAKSSPAAHALCGDCIQLANQAAQEIRTHSYLLHPPLLEVMGLAGAVEDYAQGFSARSGIAVNVEMPKDFGRLPEDMELALFRVVQESLANVLKHSHSARATIRFTRQAAFVILEVQDMGRGIPAEKLARIKAMSGGAGVGLGGMQERLRLLGGRLDLESGPAGTTVRAIVPLSELPPEPARTA
jgi:PAS domain S-box-containing protein